MSARLARVLVSTGAAALALGLVAPSAALADGEERGSDRSQANEHRQDGEARKGSKAAKGAKGDPAGNNGTIKIDDLPADAERSNRPHPGCSFALKFFNFDANQHADITFVGQAPTKLGTLKTISNELISTTPANGDMEADQTMVFSAADLGLLGTPQAKQGWHVKVMVDALEAPGGAKQKVFWLDCPTPAPAAAPAAAAPTSTVTNSTVTTAATEVAGTTAGAATGTTAGAATGAVESATAAAGRLAGQRRAAEAATFSGGSAGTAVAATTAAPQDRGSALPRTGIPLPGLIAIALATLAAGALAVRAGRRRTATDLL